MKVYRKSIALICLLLLSVGAVAQKPVGKFSFIPRAGLSIANLTDNKVYYWGGKVESKYNARFAGGVECEYQFHPILSVSLGALYSQQGCRFSDFEDSNSEGGILPSNSATGFGHFREKLDYVQVPLMLSGYLMENLAVKVGVEAGFLVNAKVHYHTTDITYKEDGEVVLGKTVVHDEDVKNTLNHMDISIPVGISYEYENVILDARYHIGLKNIYKDGDISEKNSFLTFTVGYRL